MTKKIPISFNQSEQKQLERLGELLGFGNPNKVYGATPKIIKFSINCLESYLKMLDLFIPGIKFSEIDNLASSIKNLRIARNEARLIEEREIQLQEYNFEHLKKK